MRPLRAGETKRMGQEETAVIHVYCGDGKGKTTAAIGLAVRAAGSGKRVLVLQFLKDGRSSEFCALERVENIEVVPQTRFFGFTWNMTDREREEAGEYYAGLLESAIARAPDFDMLVLDEAMGACANGMIDEERLLDFLRSGPDGLEVVMTGRSPSRAVVDVADYVTEMRKIKHPFDSGIGARLGIEY